MICDGEAVSFFVDSSNEARDVPAAREFEALPFVGLAIWDNQGYFGGFRMIAGFAASYYWDMIGF